MPWNPWKTGAHVEVSEIHGWSALTLLLVDKKCLPIIYYEDPSQSKSRDLTNLACTKIQIKKKKI